MPRKLGIVRDDRYLRHSGGDTHPESPARLASVYAMLDRPDMAGLYTRIAPRHATTEEIALIHDRSYIDYIASTAGKPCVVLDADTATVAETYDTARLAVGGVLNAVDAVIAGEVDNAFAFVRPPGHHAEADTAMGFCIFNNIAIAAMHALTRHQLQKILVVDWDLHHGNATQHSFYRDHRVLFFDTHQAPYYPGTGALHENGAGAGAGYTVNVPLSPGADDRLYVTIYRQLLEPLAALFRPDLLLLSAGFDIYREDPLGGMKVTPAGFASLMRILLGIADRHCHGRLVACLEGGYHVAGLTKCAQAVLEEMHGETPTDRPTVEPLTDIRQTAVIRKVSEQIKPYWQIV